MDYVEWANQYYADANKIKEVVQKYKERIKRAKTKAEKEELKSKMVSYDLIYKDLRNTGDLLFKRANNVVVKTSIKMV